MRICTFPLKYTTATGEDKVVYVDESDYTKYISGEKTIEEAIGHYVDKNTLFEIVQYENCKGKSLLN